MKNLEMDQLETAIITKTGHGFEVSDGFGEIIGKLPKMERGGSNVS